jgi:hypothetical protein
VEVGGGDGGGGAHGRPPPAPGAAGCVLNDVYREAERLGVEVRGVRVCASGGFDPDTWRSTGIGYVVDLDSGATPAEVAAVVAAVDEVAEIPRSIRAGAPVSRRSSATSIRER